MSQPSKSTPTGGDATASQQPDAKAALQVIGELAGKGAGALKTRMVVRDLRELRLLEKDKNARYMDAPMFNQLVENLRRDRVLTSVPLVYRDEVLSGNHRVEAAVMAGLREGFVLEIVGVLGDDERERMLERERSVAIQLSHNALVGRDDPTVLASLYGELPLDEKLYSGLTDDALKQPDPLDLASLSAGSMAMEEVQLIFMPADRMVFERAVERLGKKSKQPHVLTAAYSDWDLVFDAVVKTKKKLDVHNTALAFRRMAELALERLEQLERERPEEADHAEAS